MIVLAAIGCGGPSSREVCGKAADHFERCLGEVFGTDMKELARDHREINACTKDAATVKMYERCESQKSCQQYLDCLDDDLNASTSGTR